MARGYYKHRKEHSINARKSTREKGGEMERERKAIIEAYTQQTKYRRFPLKRKQQLYWQKRRVKFAKKYHKDPVQGMGIPIRRR